MSKLIICPHCRQNTDPSMPYCGNCGMKITLESDQITDSLKKTIASERESETLYYIRGIMVLVIFMFIVALIFSFSVASEKVLDIQPAYPLISPDDDKISGYNLGDKINSITTDSIGMDFSDFDYDLSDDEINNFVDDNASEKDDDTDDGDK